MGDFSETWARVHIPQGMLRWYENGTTHYISKPMSGKEEKVKSPGDTAGILLWLSSLQHVFGLLVGVEVSGLRRQGKDGLLASRTRECCPSPATLFDQENSGTAPVSFFWR